jgi:hypothetical protein
MPDYVFSGLTVNFPFEAYPCQKDYMEKVVRSLQEVSLSFTVVLKLKSKIMPFWKALQEQAKLCVYYALLCPGNLNLWLV